MQAPGDYQLGIYLNGLAGTRPRWPVDFAGIERAAEAVMTPETLAYVQGGCGDEFTQRHNAEAFRRIGIVPRMMVGADPRDLSVTLCGLSLPTPLLMSAVGVIGLCAPDGHGDIAAARAAAETGVPFTASTLSSDPLETVAGALGDTPGLFQLYTPRDRALAESLVGRAEAAGYRAIVVTLDTWLTGWRPRDLNLASLPQLRGLALANYLSDPVFRAALPRPPEEDMQAAVMRWGAIFGLPLTWDDLPWLRGLTRLPLILKGICHRDDAARAVDGGADAIWCSNHGGRQANGGIAAIDLLGDVIAGAGGAPVLFDSGVRSGTDVAKALAMGAAAVGIGRPYAYGAALGGADGIAHVLRCVLAELDLFMAVNGFRDIAALRAAGVRRT